MATRWIVDSQLKQALDALTRVHPYFGMTFLAFKALPLPVGCSQRLNFSAVMRQFLHKYYKPSERYSGYYNPFLTSNPSNRWVTEKYPSGALQRITVDTFGAAIIHAKGKSEWGWRHDYIDVLAQLQARTTTARIPAFHLAVWLYRNQPALSPQDLLRTFVADFNIDHREHALFDLEEAAGSLSTSEKKMSERSLLRLIGWPPGETPSHTISVSSMAMKGVGPAPALHYQPTERLNLITGDNSLGKTFLLECLWWAITGHWNEYMAEPQRDLESSSARLEYTLNVSGRHRQFTFSYHPAVRSWLPNKSSLPPYSGLAIYCRYDGSHVIWDPVSSSRRSASDDGRVMLSREELLWGKRGRDERGQRVSICNGLVTDWIDWQTRGSRFDNIFDVFVQCLQILSPVDGEPLRVGDPTPMRGDEREMPTLRAAYGIVPFVHASAGVQRIVGLLYIMIWAWFRHQRNAKLVEQVPQDCLILMVDELEAHLHPRWQRSVVPSLISAVESLSGELTMQLHFATHSPLVLASTEPLLSHDRDCLHHLDIRGAGVVLERIEFARYGSVDSWLESGVFGLGHARSLRAEKAIEKAKALQLSAAPARGEIMAVDRELTEILRDDDEFWPRWRYFAKRHRGGHV